MSVERNRKFIVESIADDLCFKDNALDEIHEGGCRYEDEAESIMRAIENKAISRYLHEMASGNVPNRMSEAGIRSWIESKRKELNNEEV